MIEFLMQVHVNRKLEVIYDMMINYAILGKVMQSIHLGIQMYANKSKSLQKYAEY